MEQLMLEKADSMKNAPKDMKFYQVYPSKDSSLQLLV